MQSRNFTATVKEGVPQSGSGYVPVAVRIEVDEDIGLGSDESIGIEFRTGTPYETAQAVAAFLNEHAYKFKVWK